MSQQPKRVCYNWHKDGKLPPNTKLCTRPSRWGNPVKIGGSLFDLPLSLKMSLWLKRTNAGEDTKAPITRSEAIELHKEYLDYSTGLLAEAKKELRGYDLACTCKLDEPCHVDYLLRRVNE